MDTIRSFRRKHPEYNDFIIQKGLIEHWILHYRKYEMQKIKHHIMLQLLYKLGLLRLKSKEEIIDIWISRYAKKFREEYEKGV